VKERGIAQRPSHDGISLNEVVDVVIPRGAIGEVKRTRRLPTASAWTIFVIVCTENFPTGMKRDHPQSEG
jgi:hypothetical protein